MARLNIERQEELEPRRMQHAKKMITGFGYEITFENATRIEFVHKGRIVKFWPYSGWASGASINDGRGLQNLLDQLEVQIKELGNVY